MKDQGTTHKAGVHSQRLYESSLWSYLVYEARIVMGLQVILPVGALPAFALLSWLVWERGQFQAELYELARAFELILPLSAGLAAAHLMSVEEDHGFDELRRSYPEPAWRLPVLRTFEAYTFSLVALLTGLLAFRWAYGEYQIDQVLLPALPPTLYLLGFSLLVGHLTRNYWAAAALVMGYWFLEVQVGRQLGHQLFLFARTFPQAELSYELNRWLLIVLGTIFMAANFWLTARRPGSIRLGRDVVEHG